jgi:GH25 family lysozyme M1 (1,4-beta-N-acetylmuramidase)
VSVQFPDVSNYQAGMPLAGAKACIAKASEGSGFTDTTYGSFRDQAKRLGIPFAAYHYLTAQDQYP